MGNGDSLQLYCRHIEDTMCSLSPVWRVGIINNKHPSLQATDADVDSVVSYRIAGNSR